MEKNGRFGIFVLFMEWENDEEPPTLFDLMLCRYRRNFYDRKEKQKQPENTNFVFV